MMSRIRALSIIHYNNLSMFQHFNISTFHVAPVATDEELAIVAKVAGKRRRVKECDALLHRTLAMGQTLMEERMACRRYVTHAQVQKLDEVRREVEQQRQQERAARGRMAWIEEGVRRQKGKRKEPVKTVDEAAKELYGERLAAMHRKLDDIYDVALLMGGDTFQRWQRLMAECVVEEMGYIIDN